jgi:arginine deiminase
MTQSGQRRIHDSQTRAGDDSGNTSVHSYTNQLKGFTQAQSALQNYMRNRVSIQNEKSSHQSYINDESAHMFVNQTQPIPNATFYRAKKPAVNQTMVMKHHVVQQQPDANSLQNLFSINSMNVTVGGANKNFFLAKDQLKQDKKKAMIKIGPVARGITI